MIRDGQAAKFAHGHGGVHQGLEFARLAAAEPVGRILNVGALDGVAVLQLLAVGADLVAFHHIEKGLVGARYLLVEQIRIVVFLALGRREAH